MARIERIELRLIDIPPKVKRTDAIQSFGSQETPIVTVIDSDGAAGTGYSYTIGTGGSSVMRLLSDHEGVGLTRPRRLVWRHRRRGLILPARSRLHGLVRGVDTPQLLDA
jgi:L-alanine-DL-glutamate epimerase-like enolase superfamily enzyme